MVDKEEGTTPRVVVVASVYNQVSRAVRYTLGAAGLAPIKQ